MKTIRSLLLTGCTALAVCLGGCTLIPPNTPQVFYDHNVTGKLCMPACSFPPKQELLTISHEGITRTLLAVSSCHDRRFRMSLFSVDGIRLLDVDYNQHVLSSTQHIKAPLPFGIEQIINDCLLSVVSRDAIKDALPTDWTLFGAKNIIELRNKDNVIKTRVVKEDNYTTIESLAFGYTIRAQNVK